MKLLVLVEPDLTRVCNTLIKYVYGLTDDKTEDHEKYKNVCLVLLLNQLVLSRLRKKKFVYFSAKTNWAVLG